MYVRVCVCVCVCVCVHVCVRVACNYYHGYSIIFCLYDICICIMVQQSKLGLF